MGNLYQIVEVQKFSDQLESDQIGGAGVTPPYLLDEKIEVPEVDSSISVDVSSIRSSLNSAQSQVVFGEPVLNLAEDNPNYISSSQSAETASTASTTSTTSSTSTTESQSASTDVSAEYDMTTYVDTTGETTVTITNPDGTTVTFDSEEAAQAYLEEESKKYDGYMVVNSHYRKDTSASTREEDAILVYQDGKEIETFEESWDANTQHSAQYNFDQWLHQQQYENGDTSYVYEYSYLAALDENSSTAETVVAVSNELDNAVNNYDPDDFYYYNDDGMMVVDTDRLADWYEKVSFLCGLLIMFQMLTEAKDDMYNLVVEELLGLTPMKGMDTKTIIAKEVQNRLARVSVAFGKLLEEMMDYNQAIVDAEVAAAQATTDGLWNQATDAITGGSNTEMSLEMQKRAVEKYLRAMSTVLDLLNKTTDKEEDGSLQIESDPAKIDEALQNGEMAIFADIPNIVYKGDNGYWELDEDELVKIRKQFYGLQNIRKALNMLRGAKQETRNMVHKEMTGVGGRESNSNAQRLQEMEDQHKTQLFETNIRLTQQKMQLENNVKYLEGEIEKAKVQRVFNVISNFLSVAAIVVGFFVPVAGLILGVLAAGVKLAGAIVANSMTEGYVPDIPSYDTGDQADTDTGNDMLDIMNSTSNMEDGIIVQNDESMIQDEDSDEGRVRSWWTQSNANPGNWFTDRASEEFKKIDFEEIARLQTQLVKIQNIRRVIVALSKEKNSMRNLVHMEMTGVGGRESSAYVDAAVESDARLAQFKFDTLTFMLNEYKNAENMAIAKDKKMAGAVNSFALSLVIQGVCAAFGGLLGKLLDKGGKLAEEGLEAGTRAATEATASLSTRLFYIGWGVGGALGGFTSSLLYELTMGSFGSSYGDDGVPAYLRTLRKNNPNSTQARMASLEARVYEELFTNGINKDIGDGYWGLNGGYVAKLRDILTRLANIQNILATLNEARTEMRNLVHLEMTGVSGRREGKLSHDVNRAEFEGKLKVFDNLVQFLGERIETQKRALDSRKNIIDASFKLGIDIAILTACAGVGINYSQIAFAFISPMMGIAHAGYDFIINSIRSRRGREIEKYDPEKIAERLKEEHSGDSTLDDLELMEMELYKDMSMDIIEDLGAGRWGVNSGVVELFRHKMERIFNIRDVLAKLQEAKAEMRASIHATLSGAGGRVGNATDAFSSEQASAMANIGTLYQNVLTIVERHNQMNFAKRAMVQSLIAASISLVNLVFVYKTAALREDYRENIENMKTAEKVARDKKILAEEKRKFADEAYSRGDESSYKKLANEYRKINADIENIKSENDKKMFAYNEHIKQYEDLGLYQFIGGLTENIAVLLAGIIYDSGVASGGKRKRVKEAREERIERREAYLSEIRSETSGSNQKGWAAGVNKSESNSLASALTSGAIDLEMEAREITSQQNDDILNNIWDTSKSSADYIKDSVKQRDIHLKVARDDDKDKIVIPVDLSGSQDAGISVNSAPSPSKGQDNNRRRQNPYELYLAQTGEMAALSSLEQKNRPTIGGGLV